MKIGILGDPHASAEPVREALAIFRREQVDAIWCTGDIAGYGEQLGETIGLLAQSGCQSIQGNHEIWYLEKYTEQTMDATGHYIQSLPLTMHAESNGKSVFMVHASPPDSVMQGIRLLDQDGNMIEAETQRWAATLSDFPYDVLIVGHTHQVFAETLANTLVINPGSTRFNHSCAILALPELKVTWYSLSAQGITKSWNWSRFLS